MNLSNLALFFAELVNNWINALNIFMHIQVICFVFCELCHISSLGNWSFYLVHQIHDYKVIHNIFLLYFNALVAFRGNLFFSPDVSNSCLSLSLTLCFSLAQLEAYRLLATRGFIVFLYWLFTLIFNFICFLSHFISSQLYFEYNPFFLH